MGQFDNPTTTQPNGSTMPKCLFKVQKILSPCMNDYRGLRIVLAIPNAALRNPSGETVPSFEKPFRLAVFGDYVDMADLLNHAKKVARAIKQLGFDDVEVVQ